MTLWRCLGLLVVFAAGIPAASLSVGTISGAAGQQVNLTVALQTQGAQISGLQFDLAWDKAVLGITVAAGSSTSAAGKLVSINSLPTSLRVLITGLNQTPITDGSVVGLTIAVASGAATGTYALALSNASATDPSGNTVTLDSTSGSVVLGGGRAAALAAAKTHSGNLAAGQTGALFSVVVSNQAGASPSSGLVAVTENLPTSLTLVTMAGSGWTCSGATCARSDPLNGGASYPPLAITVNVANNAPAAVTNQVTVTASGSASFTATDVASVTNNLSSQTISFGALNAVAFGTTPFLLTATATSGLSVTFASSTSSVCTVSTNKVSVIAAGTCTITASQSGNGTFAAASPVTQTFTVQKGAQAITFAPLGSVAVGTATVNLSATATSGLTVSFASGTTSVCTATGNTLRVIAVGTCSVTASQPGDTNYLEAPSVTRTFAVVRADAPAIAQGGVVPVYSTSTTVQAGSWISIYGTNLAASTAVWDGNFPTSLGGVSVTVNGKAAYLWFVSPTQINLQAPDDTATGSVNVVVTTAAGSFTSTVTLGVASPSLSLLDATHVAAIALNVDGTYDIVGPSGTFPYATRPVAPGEALVLYGVGFGPTDPPVKSGQPVPIPAATLNQVQVTIGGVTAPVAYSGIVGAGLYQINVTVPGGLPSGDQAIRASVSGLQTAGGNVVTIK